MFGLYKKFRSKPSNDSRRRIAIFIFWEVTKQRNSLSPWHRWQQRALLVHAPDQSLSQRLPAIKSKTIPATDHEKLIKGSMIEVYRTLTRLFNYIKHLDCYDSQCPACTWAQDQDRCRCWVCYPLLCVKLR